MMVHNVLVFPNKLITVASALECLLCLKVEAVRKAGSRHFRVRLCSLCYLCPNLHCILYADMQIMLMLDSFIVVMKFTRYLLFVSPLSHSTWFWWNHNVHIDMHYCELYDKVPNYECSIVAYRVSPWQIQSAQHYFLIFHTGDIAQK